MINFKQGWIENNDGVRKDIVVKSATPNTLKDALIGGGLVVAGLVYLTSTAFRNGSKGFSDAEYKTMVDLGIIE